MWLSKVAGLNPATSAVILAWDRDGNADLDLRADLYEACIAEQDRRGAASAVEVETRRLLTFLAEPLQCFPECSNPK